MKITSNTILILFALMILGIAALFPIGIVAAQVLAPRNETPNANPQATLDAIVQQTMIALTQTAPTNTPVPATATPLPPTNTAVPTATIVPSATPFSACDWVAFIKDVTIPDGTTFQPGETFVKTWRIKNRGTCTWTQDYALVFTGGSQMGAATAIRLPGIVNPGQTIDVSVTFTAPSTPGNYVSYWMLRNASGVLFGSGDRASTPFYADISVVRPRIDHGTVTGFISYPSEFNPSMTIYFQKVGTKEVIQFSVPQNHADFSFLLPAGTYYVYAWAPGYNLEGAFVNQDGTMKPFTVYGGEITGGILITDWQPEPHQPGL
jgi:hypothetical protein